MYKILFFSISLLSIISCGTAKTSMSKEVNPAAPGFNHQGSDAKAIAIADEVMEAMGGREAWDATNVLKWTFFGKRKHIWDKANQKCEVYYPADDITVKLNLKDYTGTVSKGSMAYTAPDSLSKYLESGKRSWINDSYWLVMPYKLKDSGVTLKYIGKDKTQKGDMSDVLELTFDAVGVTPQNKYLVYVDDKSRLVTQWDFYTNYDDPEPRFQSPWPDYNQYGKILLSGGAMKTISTTDIVVE